MIPNDLLRAIKENNCIFFLGAGMSVTSGIPINKDITDELYNKYTKMIIILFNQAIL